MVLYGIIDIFGCLFGIIYVGSNEVVSQITTLDLFVIQLCYLDTYVVYLGESHGDH